MTVFLDFEKPIAALEARIADLQETAEEGEIDVSAEVAKLRTKADRLLVDTYAKLSPWQKTQVARHPERPHLIHYIANTLDDFVPLAGDRAFGDDQAILGGLARIGDTRFVIIGHEKGDDTESRLRHNFGMGKPEGYRKAIRLMDMASRFGLPVVTLVDTSGAFPGVQAEERGQAEAIARSTQKCLNMKTPIISCITGEGGSGGAVALAATDRVLMLEHSVYSVISPEGCASILWRTNERAADAAQAMKLTADDLSKLKVIDRIIKEPVGGAHRDHDLAAATLGKVLKEEIMALQSLAPDELLARRREKFLSMGQL
jgi:acetyl-CoA carboxylase carboxyl transferase subunit alpha